ncbi:SpoIIE family protein phosphatase [Cellulomonas sp. PS-H5]|uniref:PP2C family protein-serine/threonine phosphatase n=1 Tax=Cellulomonas sp. PS-H5 TaxID=2820400 RepID=UPI0027E236AF|nr:SpoIIE family protein phosphatase [Cellulomonas sp. PS-H5]
MRGTTVGQRSLVSAVATDLGRTMALDEAVERLTRLLVPAVADWCLVTLVDDDESRAPRRRLRDVGWWHADPARRDQVAAYARERIGALVPGSMLMRAIDSGEVVHVHDAAVEALDRVLLPGPARDLVGLLAPSSLTVAPLRSRGRTLGAVSLFNGPGRPPLSPQEVASVVEVIATAAIALDNARLYRRQRDVAATFQRSLLTAPVEPDHMQVVVRYQPAAEAARVGGDWYDAFLQHDGGTMLVIGDVVGHDVEAAALMSQLRSMLRAIAVVTRNSPADVLALLDAAVRTLQIPALATVVVARVEQTPEERAAGRTRLRWSSAGHPPPMVVGPDGTVRVLDEQRPDLLLGIDPARERVDHETVLAYGETVLLYTDGLVERRNRPLRAGLADLRAALARHGARDLDDLCDALLAELPGGPGEDDVALVAVRLHPQDRPRPAEAGPVSVPPDVPAPGPRSRSEGADDAPGG